MLTNIRGVWAPMDRLYRREPDRHDYPLKVKGAFDKILSTGFLFVFLFRFVFFSTT